MICTRFSVVSRRYQLRGRRCREVGILKKFKQLCILIRLTLAYPTKHVILGLMLSVGFKGEF